MTAKRSAQDASRLLLGAIAQAPELKLVPASITQVTPLLVTMLGATGVPGVKIASLTYTTGPAVAIVAGPGNPLIIPTLTLGS